jgi:hypothetical protein
MDYGLENPGLESQSRHKVLLSSRWCRPGLRAIQPFIQWVGYFPWGKVDEAQRYGRNVTVPFTVLLHMFECYRTIYSAPAHV